MLTGMKGLINTTSTNMLELNQPDLARYYSMSADIGRFKSRYQIWHVTMCTNIGRI